jgi:hypothetical protein
LLGLDFPASGPVTFSAKEGVDFIACAQTQTTPEPRPMADFTKEWIEHLKTQISGRMNIVADKMDPQAYDELVTDLAWFAFRFARDPDTKMRKVFR